MRITALRLRNIRRFGQDGVAIESIPAGLSVLAEPNEYGKSTLFDVLRVVLFEKHSTRRENIKRLASVSGLAPIIEIDFVASDKNYRLRKQFLKSPTAELKLLDTGQILKADGEAHDWIIDLIGATKAGEGPTGLLWVEQGSSMLPPDAGEPGKTLLAGLLEREVGEVTGGERARLILKRVQEELSKLVTKQFRPKTGPYKTAIDDLEQINFDISETEARLNSAENLLIDLAQLKQTIKSLDDPERMNRIDAEIRNANERLKESERNSERLEIEIDRFEDKKVEINRYKRDLAAYDEQIQEARAFKLKLESAPKNIDDLKFKIEKLKEDLETTRNSVVQLRNQRSEAETIAKLCARVERDSNAKKTSERLRQILEKAERVNREIIILKNRLSNSPITDAVFRRIKDAQMEVDKLQERLSADSTTITPYLTPKGSTVVTLEGNPLTGKTDLAGTQLLRIGEYGEISIESNTPKEIKDKFDRAKTMLGELFSSYQVISVDDAEAKSIERRQIESRKEKLQYHLDQLAPEGISALQESYETEQAITNEDGLSEEEVANLPERSIAERNWEITRGDYDQVKDQLSAAEITYSNAQSQLNELKSEFERFREQFDKLIAKLGDESTWDSTRDEFLLALQESINEKDMLESEIEEKQRAHLSLEIARDDVQRYEEAKKNLTAKLHEKKIREAEFKRDLAAISEKGLEEELANLKQKQSYLEKQRSSYEAHIAALQLLEAELLSSQKSLQEQFLKPVSNELGPLLKIVFPDAEISLGGDFNAEEFRRLGRVETIDSLSGGTREQIAVLTRLAFAQLMAKRGREMPVILDDALVWCDDNRLENVFRALRSASRDIQCIVMTCHEKSFSTLGAAELKIEPWPQYE